VADCAALPDHLILTWQVVELFGGDSDNCFVAEIDKEFAGFV
jgi:hypothetical protein